MEVHWGLARSEWLDRLHACPGATYFHTPMWLDGVVAAFGGRVMGVEFRFPDGAWAIVPMTIKPYAKGLFQHGYAGESGVYGGVLSPSPLSPEQEAAVYAVLASRYANLQVFGNPYAAASLPEGAGWERLEHSTHILELESPEALRAGFSRGCRARGNKARRAGIKTEVVAAPEGAAIYYGLYLDSIRRWGEKVTWIRPLTFFEAVLARGEPHAVLHLARYQGRPAAAMIVCAWGERAHYLAGAADASVMEHCPSNLLMEDVADYWQSRGMRLLDLGSSNGLDGVKRFKESFGAKPLSYAEIRRQGTLGKLYFTMHRPYRRLKQSVVERLNL
ncbi:hypothetical protein D3C86_420360 [compost metagenome]